MIYKARCLLLAVLPGPAKKKELLEEVAEQQAARRAASERWPSTPRRLPAGSNPTWPRLMHLI